MWREWTDLGPGVKKVMDFNAAIVVNGSLNEIQIKHLWLRLDLSFSAAPPSRPSSSSDPSFPKGALQGTCRAVAVIIRLVPPSLLLIFVLVTDKHGLSSNPICFFTYLIPFAPFKITVSGQRGIIKSIHPAVAVWINSSMLMQFNLIQFILC